MNHTAKIKGISFLKKAGLSSAAVGFLAACLMVYMPSKVVAAACASPTTDYGRAAATANVAGTGTYRLWSRMYAPDANNNSYLLEVDGNTCFTVGDNALPAGSWTWVDYQNGNPASKVQLSLAAGNHSIKMIGRGPGVQLGRVLLISNLDCTPVGNGDNCAAVAADNTPPTIDITAPASGANVKDTVSVTATAKDNVGVTKVDFFINGILRFTDAAAPYAYGWDTKVTANGKVTIMAKAYDTAGNANSDSVQVTVVGGDAQAPTVPGGVAAQAEAYNKVTVKWSASTDNIGIAGYRILRNKVSVGQVSGATQYIDTAVLPDSTYSYQVSAYDAAGNASAPSNAVEVKTPAHADPEAPSAPTALHAVTTSPNQINLTWSASTDNIGVASYDIFRATTKGPAAKIATVTSASFGDTGLTPKTKYSYYVIAKDKSRNASTKSNTVSAETQAVPTESQLGALRGTVTFAKNTDIHAHVIIHIKGVKHSHDTDQKGNYMVPNIPAGTYKLTYQAKGHYDKEVSVRIPAGKTKAQNVTLIKR